ncbi:nucleoside deaminase [Polluticaenibacter yanchengensis]|uniref:Nucleoside deaminase n=1 Tax=Polluticaenibacter yanchengensis TaxID=3014562 RepID=A0ABT4UIP8_9BACT|nr:nucleoside deaminase [Chitinophagaceae bacterium LY-5]
MITEREKQFMLLAIEESAKGMSAGHGGPFGCVIVKGDEIVGRGHNLVLSTNDPTAHAEVVAIRDACSHLQTFQLDDCEIYCSCEPCPMCFGAIYWSRPAKIFYANTKQDAAAIGFDDQFIYDQLEIPMHERKIPLISIKMDEAWAVFEDWQRKNDKTQY